ncbi:MAG: hypothetical protein JNM44_04975 [Chitinophagaceae bacterium]|nr:hypothetical protein [Chitinophagaceae bacterium]
MRKISNPLKVKKQLHRLTGYKETNTMNKHLLKAILGGMLVGTVLFFAGPFIFIVLLLKFIFTPFGMGRAMAYRGSRGMSFAMADRIRTMSDEAYQQYREKMQQRYSGCHY